VLKIYVRLLMSVEIISYLVNSIMNTIVTSKFNIVNEFTLTYIQYSRLRPNSKTNMDL